MQDVLHVYYVLQNHKVASIVGAVAVLLALLVLRVYLARRKRRTEEGRRELDQRLDEINKKPIVRNFMYGRAHRSPRMPGLIVFVLFILLVATPVAGLINDPLFAKYGTTAKATVVDVTEVTQTSDRDNPKSSRYDVTVRYTTSGGEKLSAGLSTPDKVQADDRMSVRYLPKHPQDAIVAD